jgi:hypothetical protein
MRYKKTITIIVITIALLAFGFLGLFLGAGNYGYAQRYDFTTSRENLIEAINEFKTQNPQYKVPANLDLTDSSDSTAGYYHAYIYYPLENETIHFVAFNNPDYSKQSSIYLDAVNEGQSLGHWKEVNRDYGRNENLRVKKIFRETLLDKLKYPYKDNGNGMFIFWK